MRGFGRTFYLCFLFASACLDFGAEVPRVCFLQSEVALETNLELSPYWRERIRALRTAGLSLPASIRVPIDSTTTYTREGLDKIPSAFDDLGLETGIFLDFVEIQAVGGWTTFEGLEKIAITVGPSEPDRRLQSFELAVCDTSSGCDMSADSAVLLGDREDLFEYLSTGSLIFALSVEGSAAIDTLLFDVDICVAAEASLSRSL